MFTDHTAPGPRAPLYSAIPEYHFASVANLQPTSTVISVYGNDIVRRRRDHGRHRPARSELVTIRFRS